MTHIEVLDKVLQNHGSSYRQVSLQRGKPESYYYLNLIYRQRNTTAWMYADVLSFFGCRVLAVNGSARTDITDMILEDKTKLALVTMIKLYSAAGVTVIVTDGEDEYPVTSGELNEQTKVRGRKRGHAPRSDADLHGPGEV